MKSPAAPACPAELDGPSAQDLWSVWNRLWNGEYEIADEFLSSTMKVNIPRHGMPDPSTLTDGKKVADWIAAFRSSFEDDATITGELGPFFSGNYAIGRWVFRGTWKGGRPATATVEPGTEITFRGVDILRFENARIAEYWLSDDQLDLYDQLGALDVSRAPQTNLALDQTITGRSPDAGRSVVLQRILELTAELLEDERVLDAVGTESFLSLGLESLHAVALCEHLETECGLTLSSTAVFDHPTPRALANHLWSHLNGAAAVPAESLEAVFDRLEELATASQGDERSQLAERLLTLSKRLAPTPDIAINEIDQASAAELFAYLDSKLSPSGVAAMSIQGEEPHV